MNRAVARLLRRLTSLTATAAAVVGGREALATVVPSSCPSVDPSPQTRDTAAATPKLVYGVARRGAVQLASHSSHSSHASHASHASHYSSAGGGGSSTYTASAPTPRPAANPAPASPRPQVHKIAAAVLAKLPKVRSHWPKEVKLKQKTFFRVYDQGRVVGLMTLDAGSVLRLIDVKPQHAVVRVGDGTSPIPVENTDLVERMGGEKKVLSLHDDPPSKTPPPPKKALPKDQKQPQGQPAHA